MTLANVANVANVARIHPSKLRSNTGTASRAGTAIFSIIQARNAGASMTSPPPARHNTSRIVYSPKVSCARTQAAPRGMHRKRRHYHIKSSGIWNLAYGSSASISVLVLLTRTTSVASRSAILSAITRGTSSVDPPWQTITRRPATRWD